MPDLSGINFEVYRNRDASGGVNTFKYPFDIDDNQAVDLSNINIGQPGLRSIRQGISLVATGATFGPPMCLQEYMSSSFQSELLMVTPGDTYPNAAHLRLWSWKGNASTWSLVGTLSGFTSATLPVEITTGLDFNAPSGPPVARISTKDAVPHAYVYNGSSITLCTGTNCMPSLGAFPTVNHLNRGYAGGRAGSSRAKVHYSDPGSFTVTGWAPTQSLTMGGGNRQEIVALKTFRQGNLLTFMQDRIEMLSNTESPLGPPAGVLTTGIGRTVIDARIGCGSRRSVISMGEDVFFADQFGSIRSIATTINDNLQGTKSLPLSAPIQSWIDRINPSVTNVVVAEGIDRYYVVGFPIDSATVADHFFAYDRINEAWSGPWTGDLWKSQTLAVATLNQASYAPDTQPRLYMGLETTNAALVYRTFEGHDDAGAPIVYREEGKRLNAGQLEAKKFFRRLRDYYAATGSATMEIEVSINGKGYNHLAYAGLGGDLLSLPQTLPHGFGGVGLIETVIDLESLGDVNDIQFRWTCTANVDVQHVGYSVQFHRRNVDWTEK